MGKEVAEIVESLRKLRKPRIDRIILFGSRTRGDYLKNSDYDLIIVSGDFEGVPFPNRPALILHQEIAHEEKVQLFRYTAGEFERKSKEICLVKTAAEEGKLLFCRQSA